MSEAVWENKKHNLNYVMHYIQHKWHDNIELMWLLVLKTKLKTVVNWILLYSISRNCKNILFISKLGAHLKGQMASVSWCHQSVHCLSVQWSYLKNWPRWTHSYYRTLLGSWHRWLCCHVQILPQTPSLRGDRPIGRGDHPLLSWLLDDKAGMIFEQPGLCIHVQLAVV